MKTARVYWLIPASGDEISELPAPCWPETAMPE